MSDGHGRSRRGAAIAYGFAEQGAGVSCVDIDEKAIHSWASTIKQPAGMVGPALFLASDMSRYIRGTTPVVDGGDVAV